MARGVRNDVATRLCGRLSKGWICWYLGDLVAARALLEQCHALADPAKRAVSGERSVDPYAVMLAHLGLTLTRLGYVDQGRARQSEALSEARWLKHAQTLAEVLASAATIEAIIHSHGMQRYADELLALSTEHDLAFFLGWATVFRGRSLVAVGHARDGFVLLTEWISMLRSTGSALGGSQMWLAEAHAKLGQVVEGMSCLAEAAQIIETTEQRIGEAELHRLRGSLLIAMGDRSAAEQSYHQALASARRQSAKLSELVAAMSLARLWCDQGKRIEARGLLAPVYCWFTEGFDAPVLRDAKTLLDQLACSSPLPAGRAPFDHL